MSLCSLCDSVRREDTHWTCKQSECTLNARSKTADCPQQARALSTFMHEQRLVCTLLSGVEEARRQASSLPAQRICDGTLLATARSWTEANGRPGLDQHPSQGLHRLIEISCDGQAQV